MATFRTTGRVKDYGVFYSTFKEHGSSTTGPLLKKYGFEKARGEFVDETKSKVFRNIADENEVAIFMDGVDLEAMGAFMGGEKFAKYMEENGVDFPKENGGVLVPPGPDGPPVANMFAVIMCEDVDKWIQSFKLHADSKTGDWGFEVPVTRAEFCEDEKTRIFRCVEDSNLVAIDLVGVNSAVLGPVLADTNFQKLEKAIGEKEKAMFVVMSG